MTLGLGNLEYVYESKERGLGKLGFVELELLEPGLFFFLLVL